MPDEKKQDHLSGYELDLDIVIESYAQGMIFNDEVGGGKKVLDMGTLKYYVDPVAKKVLLYAGVISVEKQE